MIQWSLPYALWLLLTVAAVAAFAWWRSGQAQRALTAFADAALVSRLAPERSRRRRMLRESTLCVGLLLLVVALAGPKWGSHWEEVRREGVDLIVALDTSRSMLAQDVKPSRLERAKLAVLDLAKNLQGDRIGLVAFAGTAFLECPLTLDYAAFSQTLQSVDAGIIPRGGTAIGAAIRTSMEAFEARQGKHEALILITDGEDHEGNAGEIAKEAAARGIRIYTVGIGTAEGDLIPATGGGQGFVKDREGRVIKSRLNEQTLRDVALTTGGAYVHGTGASLGLEEIFEQHIAKMERRQLESTLQRRFEDRFQIPLALALGLLLLEPMLGDRRAAAVRRLAGSLRLRRGEVR